MLHRWACMLWIMSRSLLSPHIGLSITLVEDKTFVAHHCTSLNFVISPSAYYDWLVVCIFWYILLLSKSFFNDWLRYFHPCPMEIVCEVTDWCFGDFLHSSHNVSAINCCYFPWLPCLIFYLFLNMPAVYSFFRTFQVVVQANPNACAMVSDRFLLWWGSRNQSPDVIQG